ncbi:MAG TPA: polyprenyl synthetase family protein [Actinomycetota bacterium]|jgi:geranylgeranyl diphosphate synthase type I|nr:polyprenyl synthetase family protein [Actinomycetota bacterium]
MIGTVPEALPRAREMVEPALRACVDRLSPEIRRVVGYHLGLADADGTPTGSLTGKAVRPALAFLSAEAAGAPAEVGLPGAVAVELIHNFSLLHDDVMDRDRERRHRPTAWTLFGVGAAITAGDALQTQAHELLLDPPTPARVRAASALASATAKMIVGQAQDLSFESRLDVSPEESRRMCANKTGALLSCAASIGAILAEAPAPTVRALSEFGLHLGLAYQAIDDILGIWGRPEITGKPVANDLREHKKSLPVAEALSFGGPASDRLHELLSDGSVNDGALQEAMGLLEGIGARPMAEREADREIEAALGALDREGIQERVRERLSEIARFVTARQA